MLIPTFALAFLSYVKQEILSYIVNYVKSSLLDVLHTGIRTGSLRIIDGQTIHYLGDKPTQHKQMLQAEMTVNDDNFWLCLFTSHDLGFSEAYMHGDFETPDLKAVLDIWMNNRAHLERISTIISRVFFTTSALILRLFGQSLSNAKINAMTGYDCSNDLFKSFLGEDMSYSCAIWTKELGGVRGDIEKGPFRGDLEAAQLEKVHHVLRKARVRPGDRLLEFGSGWGSLAIQAALMGCTVDTITLSVEQKAEADARIKNAGLESRVTVHLLDYRQLPPNFQSSFDAFVSIEMVEHVGLKYHDKFFKIIDWALKPGRATAVISCTTQPEWRYTTFQRVDYVRRYHWPNAFCPSATSFVAAAQEAVMGRFTLESIEDHSHHYPRTLREWGRRFEKNWNADLVSALLERQPQLAEGNNLEVFRRKWRYLYVYTEVGFARAYISVHYFTFARPENPVTLCD